MPNQPQEEWITTQHGSAGWEQKLQNFMSKRLLQAKREGAVEALQEIRDAWQIKGRMPRYHDSVKTSFANAWPALFFAIQTALNKHEKPDQALKTMEEK